MSHVSLSKLGTMATELSLDVKQNPEQVVLLNYSNWG